MESTELLSHLERLGSQSGSDWYDSLEERKKAECEFHDQMRDKNAIESVGQDTYEEFYSNKKFYRTNELSKRYFEHWIEKNSLGKVVLDFACGDGKTAIKAAKAGAKMAIGIDISGVSIQNAKELAKSEGVDANTYFLQGDCENTKLPDSSVDTIICAGVLHHMDLSFVFPEMRRILAPNGKIIALEALDYNPLIKLYRMRTPHLRTEWEKAHILSLKDVHFAAKFFKLGEIRFWHLTSMIGVWRPSWLPILNKIDSFLTRIPGLKLFSWIFTFELVSDKK